MKIKGIKKIDFKYNFREYLSYLKKYKFLIFLLLLVISLNGMKQVADKYLFKIIIDEGTNFSAGTLPLGDFSRTLLIVAVVYISIFLFNTFLNWIKMHLANTNLERSVMEEVS